MPASSEIFGAFATVEDQWNNGQHRAICKCRFHVWIIAQCLQQARPWRRYGLRPFAGRLNGVLQGLVEGAPRRRAARQIGENHSVATAAAINQNAISKQGSVG
jgi:hypothetical protein